MVLGWHMHQPQYRDQITGEHLRPWAYLHGIKDYVDMAAHLESVPGACAVVNFSPVLLEQLDDYCSNLAAHLRSGAAINDSLLASLAPAGLPKSPEGRVSLIRACLRAHRDNQINRHAPYRRLVDELERRLAGDAEAAVTTNELQDLVVWYHLAWLGETVKRVDPRVQSLMEQECDFGAADCRMLLEVIADVLAGLVPRFRRLAISGRVELSVSPWGHPLLPLMLDLGSARESDPGLALTGAENYPGGSDRARWHIARAVQVFSRSFGLRPRGCWPADGAISEATLTLLEGFGFDWVASCQSVLRRSLPVVNDGQDGLVARRHSGQQLACFFRDDELSEQLCQVGGNLDGEQIATEVVERLASLAASLPQRTGHVLTLIMDGQNAWEYHADNGHAFLQVLYRRLAAHPMLQLTTFSRCLQQQVQILPLPAVMPGSWIGGHLSTWVGGRGSNEAWQQLCAAKQLFDQVVVEGGLDEVRQAMAEEALGVCEGSDWFWWMDDEQPADSAQSFDRLFRRHLRNLYGLLEEPVPAMLQAEAPRTCH